MIEFSFDWNLLSIEYRILVSIVVKTISIKQHKLC